MVNLEKEGKLLVDISLYSISNTKKDNPEPYTLNSSLIFEVNQKYSAFMESSGPYLRRG